MTNTPKDKQQKKTRVQRNWEKIKIDYLKSGLTIAGYGKKHGISEQTLYKHSKSWKALKQDIIDQADEETKKKLINAVTDANTRHLGNSKILQRWAMEHLMKIEVDPKTGKEKIVFLIHPNKPDEVINAMKSGIAIERDVLGLNEEKPAIVQSNVLVMTDREKSDLEKDVKDLMDYYKEKEKLDEALRIRRAKRIN